MSTTRVEMTDPRIILNRLGVHLISNLKNFELQFSSLAFDYCKCERNVFLSYCKEMRKASLTSTRWVLFPLLCIVPNTCHSRRCTFAGGKAHEYARFVVQRVWLVATS